MKPRAALFGGSFNPPGLHHLAIVSELRALYPTVLVIPCGPRSDKESANLEALAHRKKLCELAFTQIPDVVLDLSDLALPLFTRTVDLVHRYDKRYDVSIVVGADLLGEIRTGWKEGGRIWQEMNFAVVSRPGYPMKELPPKSTLVHCQEGVSSSEIRATIEQGGDLSAMVPAAVAEYILRHRLYSK